MADYAISNVARRVVYTNTGVGPYAFTFEILANTDIAVYRGSTLLTLTTDYTVIINANGTGSVTLVVAGTGNITIVGSRAIQRTSDYTTGGDLFASTLNTDLDSQTIYAQQVAETAERALKAPVTDPTDIAMTLPTKASRASKYLAFDANGNPVATAGTSESPSLGTMSTQDANAVAITGGSISGITDLAVADGGTGASSITANSVILGNGSSALSGNLVAPGTTGNVLTSNGTTWASQAPASSSFDAGTRLIFAQTTAPTGWTKDTTNYNNHALRVVTGAASTGGSVDFTTAFASGLSAGATTLSTSEMPSHTHPSAYSTPVGGCFTVFGYDNIAVGPSGVGGTPNPTGSTGGGGSHTHTIPSFAVKYLDVITATKN